MNQLFPSSCTSRYVGEFCEYANPCLTAPRCQNGGTCEVLIKDGQASFQCKCPVGFSASLCEISEETACSSSPCRNNGQCFLKTLKEYECKCREGFSGKSFIHKVYNSVITLRSCFVLLSCREKLREVELMRNIAMQEWWNLFHPSKCQQIQMRLSTWLQGTHLQRRRPGVCEQSVQAWRNMPEHAWFLSVSTKYFNKL